MTATPLLDERAYSKLLRKTLPTVIHTEDQNERYIEVLEDLDSREISSAEERALAELLTVLIENFEEEHYALKRSSPLAVLRQLMEAHGLKQKDLKDVFGSEGIASMVLHGKRELSKEHIRRLSKRFHVSPELFF